MKTAVSEEEKIAHQALSELHVKTGLRLDLLDINTVLGTGLWPDMRLRIAGTKLEFICEIRNDAIGSNVSSVVKQLRAAADGRASMLISTRIDSETGQALRALDINYLDVSGNAYINMPPFFVFIDGQRDSEKGRLEKSAKSYSQADLQVIFALLSNPKLLNANYGEIASFSNVALGVCGAVFRDLKDRGYFTESLTTKKREWCARYKLLGQWVAQYPLLREKHFIGSFRPASPDWWRSEEFSKYDAQLGGKFAVAAYTDVNYTNIDKGCSSVIHLADQQQWQFAREMRFEKSDESKLTDIDSSLVAVFSKFWGEPETHIHSPQVVHPLISYADLIDAGDDKSISAANQILSRHLV